MSNTLLEKAGLVFLLLLSVTAYIGTLLLLINSFLWIKELLQLVLELTRLG
jgi:hypothetical protein